MKVKIRKQIEKMRERHLDWRVSRGVDEAKVTDEEKCDVEIVCTEWQGDKMVYVFEVRIGGMLKRKLF